MNEQQIMELITKEYTWDQVLYQIIAWEGLDPWDLDLSKLTNSFFNYLSNYKEISFKVPAKFLIIASMLLRMKCDHLHYYEEEEIEAEIPEIEEDVRTTKDFHINDISFPPTRQPIRRVVIDDLVSSLRRTLKAHKRREKRAKNAKGKIKLKEDHISKRISLLYTKINDILGKIKKEEVKFSKLVDTWERPEVFNTFLPLLYLDNEKKVDCRQDKFFREIFIKKGGR